MDTSKLYPAILLITLVIVLVAVGVLVTDKMAIEVREPTSAVDNALTCVDAPLPTKCTTTNGNILSISAITNSTRGTVPAVNYSNYTSATGVITLEGNWSGGAGNKYNITYTYDRDTAATDSLESGRDAITTVNTSWMSIIILVMVMSILITLIISSFVMGRSKR